MAERLARAAIRHETGGPRVMQRQKRILRALRAGLWTSLFAISFALGAQAAPNVVFLVDQGGGMSSSCGAQTCWDAVRSAVQSTITTYSAQAEFGAAIFGGDGGATCPILSSVAPAPGSGAAVNALLAGATPEFSEKPLGDAIAAAAPLVGGGGAPRTLIVVFRGVPDTCAQPTPNQGETAAIAAAQAANVQGIRVVVVGIGTLAPSSFLQDLANAGAGLPIGGAQNAAFYVVANASELTAAFEAGVESGLAAPVPTLAPSAIGVLSVALFAASWGRARRRDVRPRAQ